MQEKEYTWCFACGKDNPIGLKMEFTMDAEECVAYFTPRQEHQSYELSLIHISEPTRH